MLIGIDANEANIHRRVGVNQYAFNLLQALSRLKTKHDFVIYHRDGLLPDLPPVSLHWDYRYIPFPGLWTQTRLPWDLFTHRPRPDVFFSPSHYAPRYSPVPTVIAVMDLGFLTARDQFNAKDFNQLKSWTAYSAKKASKIIVISEFTKNAVVKTYHRQAEDVIVTYPGYDNQVFFPRDNPAVLEKYHIHRPYILYIGSLKPSKNLEGLITAFSRLEIPGLTLVIAGKRAWLYERIFGLVADLKLQDRVIFTGFVKDREVPVLMSRAIAFAMPSFHEGFGIPVLEAMACHVPVVVSDVASLPEVAGDAGIYVRPDDIDSIAGGLHRAMGPDRDFYIRKGGEQAAKFDWSKTASRTISVLESAI